MRRLQITEKLTLIFQKARMDRKVDLIAVRRMIELQEEVWWVQLAFGEEQWCVCENCTVMRANDTAFLESDTQCLPPKEIKDKQLHN